MKKNTLADKIVQNPRFNLTWNSVEWEMEIGMVQFNKIDFN